MQKLKHLKWHAMPEVGVVVALAVVALAMTLAPRRVQAKEVDYVSGATVVAQSSEGPEHPAAAVVDGSLETWWISDDMKAGQEAGQSQTPQWIVIDLGPSFSPSSVTSIAVDWRPNKVWGQAYRVETADGYDGDNTSWTTMARVERDAKGLINPQNADGQNIADGVRDTITASSTPALEDGATAHRYVRLYIEKVNEAAPGNNVNVCDLHIMGEVGPEEPGGSDVEPWNVALGRPAVASSVDEGTSAESAVDGGTTISWNSAPMKDVTHSDTSGDDDAQTPQWLYVDLGVSGTQLSSIQVIFKSNKVWAQQYEIQTSDEAPNPETGEAGWTTVASVSRASAFATLTQGAGQNIASPSSYADTITASTTPALEQATLGRYVRLYVEKTNWQAPGVNVNIAEFVVNGVNSLRPLSDELDKLKTETVYVEGGKLVFPEAPRASCTAPTVASLRTLSPTMAR